MKKLFAVQVIFQKEYEERIETTPMLAYQIAKSGEEAIKISIDIAYLKNQELLDSGFRVVSKHALEIPNDVIESLVD